MKAIFTLFATVLCACSGPAPSVPAVEASKGDCLATDSAKAMPTPATKPLKKSPGLAGLKPSSGVGMRPLGVGQMLTLPHAATDLQWRALPQTADAELITVVGDPKADVTARARAMSGLAIRNTEGGRDPIVKALSSTDDTLKRAAIRSLCAAYIEDAGGPVTDAVLKTLADPSVTVREAAVKALTPHVTKPAIKAALEARAAVETEALVKEALTAALGA